VLEDTSLSGLGRTSCESVVPDEGWGGVVCSVGVAVVEDLANVVGRGTAGGPARGEADAKATRVVPRNKDSML
jgi:hypothetical protein